MALSANAQRFHSDGIPELIDELPADAAVHIYEGAAVGENASTGYMRGLVAGDTFHGMAERECDNSAGAAGAKRVAVRRQGEAELSVATVASVADVGDAVYASADGTFTKSSGGSATQIGKITRYVGGTDATKCMVFYQGTSIRSI